MNRKTTLRAVRLTAAAILMFGLPVIAVMAESPATGASKKGGEVTVEGTATLYGKWSCKGDAIVETLPGEALEPVPGFPGGVQAIQVTVAVKELDCGDGTMNKHLRNALKEKNHPEIRFKTTRYALNENGDVVKAYGELTIAGVTRDVELNATLTSSHEGGFQVEGKVNIRMKDYEVKPPSRLFGALKVSNDISITYTATIESPDKTQRISASLKNYCRMMQIKYRDPSLMIS